MNQMEGTMIYPPPPPTSDIVQAERAIQTEIRNNLRKRSEAVSALIKAAHGQDQPTPAANDGDSFINPWKP